MAKTVHALLEDIRLLGHNQFQVVEAVRALVKANVEPLSEEVKYGGILFSCGVPFGGVFAYKEHVSVEFGHGAMIKDELGFLEGKGKGRRHIKLRNLDDISTKQLGRYLCPALVAAKGGGSQGD